MTAIVPGDGTPESQPPPSDGRRLRWPDASTRWGAILYAIIGGFVASVLITVLSHVHVVISWH
jgi:hypothetical protein